MPYQNRLPFHFAPALSGLLESGRLDDRWLNFKTKVSDMLRSIFFSTGLFVVFWGITLLFVDQVTLTAKVEESEQQKNQEVRGMISSNSNNQKVINPPEWAAFSLMSVGAVTMLYAVALPKRKAFNEG